MNIQQGDVLLQQTADGGEICVTEGITEMTAGLENLAYLSLFGGNETDDGSQDSPFNWWGNLSETEVSRQYRSETQYLLRSIPATSNNLTRIKDAAERDLASLEEEQVNVTVTIPDLNRVKIVVKIRAIGEEFMFTFVENWKASI